MRWEALFADLQTLSAAQQQQEFEVEIAEAVDLAWSRASLSERFRAHQGHEATIELAGGTSVALRVGEVGSDWLSGSAGSQSWLIPVGAVISARGLARRAQPAASPTQKRLGVGAPLRALAAAGEPVVLHGSPGMLMRGVLAGVGSDFVDMRCADPERGIRTVPIRVIVAVRSSDPRV